MDQNTTTYYRRSFPYLIAKLIIGCSFLILQVACNTDKDMADITPVIDPVDTTVTDQDTTVMDSIIYEDAPIWLPGGQTHGFARGKKNGKDFEASAYAIRGTGEIDHLIGVFLDTYSEYGYKRENITLGEMIITVVKKYSMNLNDDNIADTIVAPFYATVIADGDVLGDVYQLDTTYQENYVNMIEIDITGNSVKGTFNAAFINQDKDDKSDPRNPDYCVFEDVYFECKIVE